MTILMGSTQRFKCVYADVNGLEYPLPTQPIWSVSTGGIVSFVVDELDKSIVTLTPITPGTTTLTCVCGGKLLSMAIVVEAPFPPELKIVAIS